VTGGMRIALGAVVTYQRLVSPLLPSACRFAPTCSEYAKLAIEQNGLLRGVGLAAWRFLRCQPFHPGGEDLPPTRMRRT
jgi:putative membrane protein insertion efficiency factor